ncbi:MAG TPA: hypothetical protein VN026_07840 [Bacteroidia bacterium]|jgi:hypothetical protein|nr:hypothetical protein [Bacteroidia bacterium]
MISVAFDELYDLIKSLTKSEKRFFKLTVSSEDHATAISKLFDELEKAPDFDENKLLKSSKQKHKTLSQIDIIQLTYTVILKSQRTFYAEGISGYRIKDEISNLRNLFDKAQYKQCRKMLNKLKEESYSEESFHFILEIISIEKQLLDIENKFGNTSKSLDDLIQEEQLIIDKSKNIGEYAQSFSRVNYLVRQNMVAKTAKEFETYDKLLSSPLFKTTDNCSSKKAEVLYHHTRALCFSKKRDNINRQLEFKSMVTLMDKNPFLINEYPKRYLSGINNILSVEIEQAHYGTAEKLIDSFIKLKSHPAFNTTDLQLKIFTSTTNAQLLIYTDGGRTDKAIPVVKYINEQIELYKDKINKEELLIFYYNFTSLYIYSQKYAEASKYLNLLLSKSDTDLRQDLQCFSRLQNIILHYELQKIPELKYLLKTTHDFYKNQKYQFKIEKLILELFEELAENGESKTIWDNAHKQIKELMHDPFEKIANYYFDFLAYTQSKVTGEKVGDIIFDKLAQNWKK